MAKTDLEDMDLPTRSVEIVNENRHKMRFVPQHVSHDGPKRSALEGCLQAYNSFQYNAGLTRSRKLFFVSVAFAHCCKYCMSAHSFVADQWSKVPLEITNAIRDEKQVPNRKLNALNKLTESMTHNRGKFLRKSSTSLSMRDIPQLIY